MRAAMLALVAALALGPALAQERPMRPPALQARIDAALAAMPSTYVPRTRHTGPAGPLYTNRLILEPSPYLRQHAHNPVDWRPWGEAALAEAAARDVPVFLSLGYATCHWCHVMEEESFDDVGVGDFLNANYVAVKVDREELPDIDAQYMYATLALTGSGGWPNNLVLTPRGEPFGAFSYTPRGQFLNVMANVVAAWTDPAKRGEVEAFAADVAAVVREEASRSAAARSLDERDFRDAASTLAGASDPFLGGWGDSQKFPNEVIIRFLLDQAARTGDAAMEEAALRSLRAIAAGGIHDHAGGGFHRYTVDPEWRTPHFEKMLYNQALIAPLMIEGWRRSGDGRLRRAAERTLDYVLRDMTAPQGAFYSAEDADSLYHGEMEEGAFYVWTADQVAAAGADTDFALNTLGLYKSPTVPAGAVAHLDPDATPDFARLDPVLERLRLAREQRPHPLVDTKIITGWNGLMIRALAQGGAAMGTGRHIRAAERAAGFLWSSARRGEGLSRVWAEGAASGEGRLEDYAWFGLGLVALYDATGETLWLDRAAALAAQIGPRFGDAAQNGLLRMAEKPGPLGARLDMEDSATPSGNASTLELFALLAQRSDDPAHRARADALLAAMSGLLGDRPTAHPEGLTAAQVHLFGETGPARSMAAGKLRVSAHRAGGSGLTLALDFAPGWHANADRVRQDWLVPTELAGPGVGGVRYPQARTVRLGFSDEPLDVIDGRVEIEAASVGEIAELHIQVCSDETCLLPETATFRPGAAW